MNPNSQNRLVYCGMTHLCTVLIQVWWRWGQLNWRIITLCSLHLCQVSMSLYDWYVSPVMTVHLWQVICRLFPDCRSWFSSVRTGRSTFTSVWLICLLLFGQSNAWCKPGWWGCSTIAGIPGLGLC